MPFDPYHKWLGIPPSEQPPDRYRLLGVGRFESDPEVIDAAANRQMAYVQGFAQGERGAASQRLLNELSAARLCLLDPASRAAYDASLARESEAAPPPPRASSPPDRPRPRRVAAAPPPPEPEAVPDRPAWTLRPLVLSLLILAALAFVLARGLHRPAPPAAAADATPTLAADEPLPPPDQPGTAAPPEPVAASEAPAPPAEWRPPAVVPYQESAFAPIFHGRTIDGPLTDVSNCWMEERYTDFVLRFDYRLRTHDRREWNGVRLRHGGPRLSLVLSEGLSGGLLLDRSIPGLKPPLVEEAIDPSHRVVRPAKDAENTFGQWNRCEVVCEGPSTTVSINGQVVNHIPNGPTGAGLICLSGHDDGVAFRGLRVLNLGPTPGPAPDEPPAPAAARVDKPTILRWRTSDWEGSPSDFARVQGREATLGMGDALDFGIGQVGLQVEGLKTLKLRAAYQGPYKSLDANTMVGLVVDYRTPQGYSKRVALHLDRVLRKRWATNPAWGKGARPDASFLLKNRNAIDLDLSRWAPADWDGRAWVTAVLQNTGRNTVLTLTIVEMH